MTTLPQDRRRPARADALPADDGLQAAAPTGFAFTGLRDALRDCPFWILLLTLALLVPTDFSVNLGGLRLSAYRIVLLFALFPALRALGSDRVARLMLPDVLVGLHLLWSFIVYAKYHGMGVAMETGGVRILEFGGAYLVARAYLVDARTFLGFGALLVYCVCLLAPLALFESLTGFYPIKELTAAVLGLSFYNNIEPRLGLWRAIGPFDHPILLGVFASSALGITWALNTLPNVGKRAERLRISAVLLTTGMSLSAGPLMSLFVQCVLVIWRRITTTLQHRWRVFTILLVTMYFAVDLLSSRPPIRVFLTYLTFSDRSAYNRLAIFDAGIKDVERNPIFGIGLNPWGKPSWMHSDSMDNFWLFQAVSFGMPGFLMLAIAVISLLRRAGRAVSAADPTYLLRVGWIFSVVGLILAGTTVHFWNSLFCYFGFLLGAGAWFAGSFRAAESTAKTRPAGKQSAARRPRTKPGIA